MEKNKRRINLKFRKVVAHEVERGRVSETSVTFTFLS